MDAVVAKRLEGVHPNARRRLSKDPKYVSTGLQEYLIKQQPVTGQWYIARYKGGQLAARLQGFFTTFQHAEEILISHLRSTERRNKAIWPGR